MSTQSVTYFTPEQYLELDRNSEVRNEYIFGEIVAMAGGMPMHSLLIANTILAVGKRLSSGSCRVFDSNLRVCLHREALYSYPDATVVCGPLEFVDDKKDTVTNPKVAVEVLSRSTRNYDLGAKARMYFQVPSLTELLFIDQDQIWIEHWRRQPNGRWDVEVVHDRDAVISLESIDCEAPVSEIYAGVELNEPQSSLRV